MQSCAGVPEGAAVEGFIDKLDACLLELECGLLVNITELRSMSRISHVSQAVQYSMKDSGHDSSGISLSLQEETVPVGGICHAFAVLPDIHVCTMCSFT